MRKPTPENKAAGQQALRRGNPSKHRMWGIGTPIIMPTVPSQSVALLPPRLPVQWSCVMLTNNPAQPLPGAALFGPNVKPPVIDLDTGGGALAGGA